MLYGIDAEGRVVRGTPGKFVAHGRLDVAAKHIAIAGEWVLVQDGSGVMQRARLAAADTPAVEPVGDVTALATAAGGADPFQRLCAAWQLSDVEPQPAARSGAITQALRGLLADPDWRVRATAAQALAKRDRTSQRASSVVDLCGLLKDLEPAVRRAALAGLAIIGTAAAESAPAVREALSDEHWVVRTQAAATLQSLGEGARAAAPALSRALTDEVFAVRWRAICALKEIGFSAAEAPAVVAALDDPSPEISAACAALLAKDAGASAAPALLAAAQGENGALRARALDVMQRLGPKVQETVPALVELLGSPDENVRSQAALVLRAVGEAAEAPVAEALAMGTPEQRLAAAQALRGMSSAGDLASSALVAVLREGAGPLRTASAGALSELGSPGAAGLAQVLAPIIHERRLAL